jgi:hypothetical protein
MIRITRAEVGEIFKKSVLQGGELKFPCAECGGDMVSQYTHPKMGQVLINYFNEEVCRSLEGTIKIMVDDHPKEGPWS